MSLKEETVLAINSLWEPVYPFMAEHLLETSGVRGGRFLDLGPFAGGLALNVLWRSQHFLATVCDESPGVLRWVEERAAIGGYVSRLTTIHSEIDPIPAGSESFDLVAVRGAFFFLTPHLLQEIRRVLRPGGFGWVGGGYGKSTPSSVIEPLANLSRDLNAQIGKRWIAEDGALTLVKEAGLSDCCVISSEGGLWIEVRS
jgi:SAM-dependent methyltransferase